MRKARSGDTGEPGAIKFKIVQTLPVTDIETDAIYLVPIEPDESDNNYAEYIYVDGAWEQLGKIAVHVDLSDYVKNTDYATSSVGGVVKTGAGFQLTNAGTASAEIVSYSNYQSRGGSLFISKSTLENVITGKGLVRDTDYATTQKTGVIKLSYDVATQGNASTGVMSAITKTYEQYTSAGNGMFIGKGTLENVLNEKIGNIESILETLDTGSGV